MTPDEKNLIGGLFSRLKSAEASAGPVDREAAGFIQQSVAEQPSAPYLLVQTVLVQEHALNNAQQRIADLENSSRPPSRPSRAAASWAASPTSSDRGVGAPTSRRVPPRWRHRK